MRAPNPKVSWFHPVHQAILLNKVLKARWGMVPGCDKVKTPQVDNEALCMAKAKLPMMLTVSNPWLHNHALPSYLTAF